MSLESKGLSAIWHIRMSNKKETQLRSSSGILSAIRSGRFLVNEIVWAADYLNFLSRESKDLGSIGDGFSSDPKSNP